MRRNEKGGVRVESGKIGEENRKMREEKKT